MRRSGVRIAVALALLLAAIAARASIFGTVRGIVHDVQHRPIQNATITLQAKASHWGKTTTSDEEGRFQMDAVPAGEYAIHISRANFRDIDAALTVVADTAPLLHYSMELAGLSQRIEVKENTQGVNATSSTSVATITAERIRNTPGATRTNSLDFITAYTPGADVTHDLLHVRGGHQFSWLVDGVPVPNTNIAANVGPQFDPKDIELVEIQRGSYAAEYGDRTYAVFNVIPRSGFERNREMEVVATYGSFHSTDSQISFGDHTDRFAYYTSVSANRTDVGLMTPEPEVLHGGNNGVSGFTSLIFNATPRDQLRLVASSRADYFQVPNTLDQELSGERDAQRERDAFANFSWVRTFSTGVLLTVAPFYHWNHSAYDGYIFGPETVVAGPTNHIDSRYAGGLTSLGLTRGRHNAAFGLYAFAQSDDDRFGPIDESGAVQSSHPGGSLVSLFGEDQFHLTDWLTLNGGLRYTHFSAGVVEDKTDPRVGAALRIPRLNWVLRAAYSRYYQAPPLQTLSGQVGDAYFLPLHGEVDEQREFGLAIPFRGFVFDVANFRTHARNFFDHDMLGNSGVFFPLTIERARIGGWETTARTPRIAKRLEAYLTYSHQFVEGAGVVTGGLVAEEGQLCEGGGFCFLDHDQRDTLHAGFHALLPWSISASGNLGYGSGFLDGDGPSHLPGHTEFSLSLRRTFGERFSVAFTAQNITDSRYLIDNSSTFGGTHWNYPRQFTGEIRYRFHY